MRNYWTEHASALARAYLQGDGTLRFAVVTRAIHAHLGSTPARVLDVGGGQAQQAVQLARVGHQVTVLDIDTAMLDAARILLVEETEDVRKRVRLVCGPGEDAASCVGTDYDLVCCHSVLMYLEEPELLLKSLVRVTRNRGFLSILSFNTDAAAMRSGLQSKWQETVDGLRQGCESGSSYLTTSEPPRGEVCAMLEQEGASTIAWYGVGIFTDHLTESIVCDDPQLVIDAEWLAGLKDPYRSIARCFHLIAMKG